MKVEFRKGKNKSILVCTRDDNSSTWMQADTFFIAHDLAHYAVETNFKFSKGFYGLVKSGMNISDFQDKLKFKSKEIEAESIYAEHLVNLILSEMNDGKIYSDFQQEFARACRQAGLPELNLDSAAIDQARSDLYNLLSQWRALQPEEKIILQFA